MRGQERVAAARCLLTPLRWRRPWRSRGTVVGRLGRGESGRHAASRLALGDPENPGGRVVVGDHRPPVVADRQRRPGSDVAVGVDGRDRGASRRAAGVPALDHLERGRSLILVADDRQWVSADRDRRPESDAVGRRIDHVETGRRRAGRIAAPGDGEPLSRPAVHGMTDHRHSVAADGDRRVGARRPAGVVEGGDRRRTVERRADDRAVGVDRLQGLAPGTGAGTRIWKLCEGRPSSRSALSPDAGPSLPRTIVMTSLSRVSALSTRASATVPEVMPRRRVREPRG